ncbi:hypothetical protein C5167_006380 [Papaver somniferum]|uniref:GTD-binding domain-containing protein n=1 Tax=Papaver somniferum TaxID=3469 RepID=A0A4Y7JE40_PAPSO|nr:hypothetical protein C5167_006380 [Papaver somniferum]
MASKSSNEHVEQQLGNPSKKKEQQLTKIPHFLIYVILFFMIHLLIYIILQWIIIIVLFLNGLIAFIASEFARFFDLRIPCFLCTRFDHVLLKKNLYYNDSMCEDHRKEVSSMVFCHIHQRMSDIRLMCEECLQSSNTGNKPSFGSCKPMQGLFGVDTDHLHLPNGEYERYLKVEKGATLQCSCCGQPQGVKVSSSTKLVQKSVSHVGDFPPTPSPSPRIIASVNTDEARAFDELSHVQYSELNIMSDADSEIPDDEFRSNALARESQGKEDMKAATAPLLPEVEDLNEEPCKSPNFLKGSRFYGFTGLDSGTASPAWPPKIPIRSPGEKADSVAESVEGISTNEADVETVLHRLKRQVRLDRKTLMAMYMELDEERSSSAVAANQAMAMITRLQAEKAAIQLEALQYQRIMEEQAEYDQQALQVMKDLLNKREEIIKVLEAELRSYRGLDSEGHSALLNDGYQDSSFGVKLSTQLCDDYSYNVNEETGENDTGPSQLKILEKKIQSPDLDDAIQSLPSNLKYEGEGSNINISKAISHLHEKLTGLETDKEFLKHTLPSLQKGDEGTQLLREIAKHLWYLRHTYNMPSEVTFSSLS